MSEGFWERPFRCVNCELALLRIVGGDLVGEVFLLRVSTNARPSAAAALAAASATLMGILSLRLVKCGSRVAFRTDSGSVVCEDDRARGSHSGESLGGVKSIASELQGTPPTPCLAGFSIWRESTARIALNW
jgi:hypothetical protein